jgi:hypothetical protein
VALGFSSFRHCSGTSNKQEYQFLRAKSSMWFIRCFVGAATSAWGTAEVVSMYGMAA